MKATSTWFVGFFIISAVILSSLVFSIATYSSTHNIAHAEQVIAVDARSSLQFSPQANGPYTVDGNAILDANGQPYHFYGVARDSLQYDCNGDGHFTRHELAYMGSGTNTTNTTYWGANSVRLPLSEAIWLHGLPQQQCTAQQYQTLIKQIVDSLTALKLNVMLDLHWSDAGGQVLKDQPAGGSWSMPDADSVTFWQQVAPIYAKYTNVLFELFNEPHLALSNEPQSAEWTCWLSGCLIKKDKDGRDNLLPTYQSVGMQTLVNTVRGTHASNLVLVGGKDWGYNLSEIGQYAIKDSNVVYDTHPYTHPGKETPTEWDAAFGNISHTYPVISAGFGDYDCGTSFVSQLLAYFDKHQMSWLGWAWVVNTQGCAYPLLVKDYNGTPFPGMGEFIYQHLRSYTLGSPTPTPTEDPTPSPSGPPGLPPTGSDPNL